MPAESMPPNKKDGPRMHDPSFDHNGNPARTYRRSVDSARGVRGYAPQKNAYSLLSATRMRPQYSHTISFLP